MALELETASTLADWADFAEGVDAFLKQTGSSMGTAVAVARALSAMSALGSNASVQLSWHVGFTPDFGLMVATQGTDASGQEETKRDLNSRRRCHWQFFPWLLAWSVPAANGLHAMWPSSDCESYGNLGQ